MQQNILAEHRYKCQMYNITAVCFNINGHSGLLFVGTRYWNFHKTRLHLRFTRRHSSEIENFNYFVAIFFRNTE